MLDLLRNQLEQLAMAKEAEVSCSVCCCFCFVWEFGVVQGGGENGGTGGGMRDMASPLGPRVTCACSTLSQLKYVGPSSEPQHSSESSRRLLPGYIVEVMKIFGTGSALTLLLMGAQCCLLAPIIPGTIPVHRCTRTYGMHLHHLGLFSYE